MKGTSGLFRKLGNGFFSVVFLKKQGKSFFVFKYPKYTTQEFHKKWFYHVCAEDIFLKKYIPDRTGVILPKYMELTKNHCIQKYISGKPLTKDIYEKLPQKEQMRISRKLATFFIKLHQNIKKNYSLDRHEKEDNLWLDYLDTEELKIYQQSLCFLKKNPSNYDFSCMCIGDLKAEHLLYNKKTKKIGMIDFGSVHYGSPADDFNLNYPIRSHLSIQMLRDIIFLYNKKSPIISLEYIKNNLILSSFREVYENYINQKISFRDKKYLKKMLFDFKRNIENVFKT